jgi:REP element-mobilizing transposase RayT
MPGTFSQIYIQVVFAVKGRQSLIHPSWESQLYKYITGVVQNKDQKMLAINGMPDHIHILFGMRPTCTISNLVQEVKKASNQFINEKKFTPHPFSWQNGFGVFSYRHSDLHQIIEYISNQKDHHQTISFRNEYTGLLKVFGIEYRNEYLFEWLE